MVNVDSHTEEVTATNWALAKVANGFAYLSNERFHTFAVKKNGEVIGELVWKSRQKSAGSPAWQGTIFNSKKNHGMDVVFYDTNKQKVLEWFKDFNY